MEKRLKYIGPALTILAMVLLITSRQEFDRFGIAALIIIILTIILILIDVGKKLK